MNQRLPLDASGEDLITLSRSDIENAIKRFITAKPPEKKDPALLGGEKVEYQLKMWALEQYAPLFVRAGYRQLSDLIELQDKDVRALGVSKDADARRMMQLVARLKQEHATMMQQMDALYIDPDMVDMRTWLEKRHLAEWVKLFEKHRIDFEVLGDLSYEDLKEIGLSEVGPRRKVYRAITQWRDERDQKKAEAIRARMEAMETKHSNATAPRIDEVTHRIMALKAQQSHF